MKSTDWYMTLPHHSTVKHLLGLPFSFSLSFFNLRKAYPFQTLAYFCVYECFSCTCAYMYHIHAWCLRQPKRGRCIRWNWYYEKLWPTRWVLGVGSGSSSAKATSDLGHGASLPAPTFFFLSWAKRIYKCNYHQIHVQKLHLILVMKLLF